MPETATYGPLSGHLARPAAGKAPGLIVIHEWLGLDAGTRRMAERFAQAGYLAFAPDLYHGQQAPPGDVDAARALTGQYGPGAPAELAQAAAALRADPACTGRVGAVGFCFGGRMALATALEAPLDAVCTFYGGGMQVLFDRLGALRCPVLGLFGEDDGSIPVGTIDEFKRRLAGLAIEHQVVIYPNAAHAFMREGDPRAYRPEAAADAWQRALAFFGRHLLGAGERAPA
jgi:carboxymethylenebutenolidase